MQIQQGGAPTVSNGANTAVYTVPTERSLYLTYAMIDGTVAFAAGGSMQLAYGSGSPTNFITIAAHVPHIMPLMRFVVPSGNSIYLINASGVSQAFCYELVGFLV